MIEKEIRCEIHNTVFRHVKANKKKTYQRL